METEEIKILLDELKRDVVKTIKTFGQYSDRHSTSSQKIKARNLINLLSQPLFEHRSFLEEMYDDISYADNLLEHLTYLELLINMEERGRIIVPKGLLDSAAEKLAQAGTCFSSEDYSGVSNKLNTCIELALKDVLEIPTTIKGINTSKIIDVMISEKIGAPSLGKYLEEVKNHVLMDNLVKHVGVAPIPQRAVMAIAATENLLKKLPNMPFNVAEDVREKIWSGVK